MIVSTITVTGKLLVEKEMREEWMQHIQVHRVFAKTFMEQGSGVDFSIATEKGTKNKTFFFPGTAWE